MGESEKRMGVKEGKDEEFKRGRRTSSDAERRLLPCEGGVRLR